MAPRFAVRAGMTKKQVDTLRENGTHVVVTQRERERERERERGDCKIKREKSDELKFFIVLI